MYRVGSKTAKAITQQNSVLKIQINKEIKIQIGGRDKKSRLRNVP